MDEGQRIWQRVEPHEWTYHREQYEVAYPNTTALLVLLAEVTGLSPDDAFTALDIGCGAGANVMRLLEAFPSAEVVGIDVNAELLEYARGKLGGDRRVTLLKADLLDFEHEPFDVTLAIQLLSWLEPPLAEAAFARQLALSARWAVLTALFTEAEGDYETRVTDHAAGKVTRHEVLSLPRLTRRAEELGFRLAVARPFEIGVDVAPAESPRSFRTLVTAEGRRLQFAGDLYMPWYHVVFERRT